MDYVGSISVLDRGDGPAQAILDKNARALATRVTNETREQLEEVLTRVDNIYGNFELTEQMQQKGKVGRLEYLDNLSDLEDLLQDSIKKKKYQHQVTVFIVGYESVCGQKLKLLQQVNDFFMDTTNKLDDESLNPKPQSPDINVEEASKAVEESLTTANELTTKLEDINKEMVEYLTSYANNKAGSKGRRKLEKALGQAKDDITALSEKLMQAQQDLEDREDKMQHMFKQVEIKNMEIQKYKTAAEVAKRASGDTDSTREEMDRKDALINELKKKVDELQLDLAQKEHSRELTQTKLKNATVDSSSRLKDLQEEVQNLQLEKAEDKREFQRFHDDQVAAMHSQQQEDISRLNAEHGEEIKKLMKELEGTKTELMHAEFRTETKAQNELNVTQKRLAEVEKKLSKAEEKNKDLEFAQQQIAHLKDELVEKQIVEEELRAASQRESSRVDNASKQSKRESPARTKSVTTIKQNPANNNNNNSSAANNNARKSSKSVKETSDASVQDEGGNPETAISDSRRSTKLDAVDETDSMFEDEFELEDEDAWMGVPKKQVSGRFKQYRKLTRLKLNELMEKLGITQSRTTKKVTTLKAQFQEHKKKWELERNILIEQIEQAQKLQQEAEKEADSAMSQLEEFIVEQEHLEKEEDEKRKEVQRKEKPAISLQQAEASLEAALDRNASTEKELTELLQQTDDAKSLRIHSSASNPQAAPDTVLLRKTSSSGTTDIVLVPEPEPRADTNNSLQPPESRLSSQQQAASSPNRPSSLEGAAVDAVDAESRPATAPNDDDAEEAADLTQRLSDTGKISTAATEQNREGTPTGRRSNLKSPHPPPSGRSRRRLSVTFMEDEHQSYSTKTDSAMSVLQALNNLPKDLMEEACDSLEALKEMMVEQNLTSKQVNTLTAVRGVVSSQNEDPTTLTDEQYARTLTIFALANQLVAESILLGFEPSGLFETFGKLSADPSSAIRKPMSAATHVTPGPTSTRWQSTIGEISDDTHSVATTAAGERAPGDTSGFASQEEESVVPDNKEMDRELTDALADVEKNKSTSQQSQLQPAENVDAATVASNRESSQSLRAFSLPGFESALSQAMGNSATSPQEGAPIAATVPAVIVPQSPTRLSIHGQTEEEIRQSSAASRSSLRSKYKVTLSEKRSAFEGRRSRSPAVSIQSQASFHEAVLDENGDMPFPHDIREIGTSPPPGMELMAKSRETSFAKLRQGFHILDHPITVSYLECYFKMVNFKDDISKVLMDKDMMSMSQVLSELETMALRKEDPITPQIEEMTHNVYHILDEVSSLVSTILSSDREYPVSSLMTASRDMTRGLNTREKSTVDTPFNVPESMAESRRSVALSAKSYNSKGSDFQNLKDLQQQFDLLQNGFADETKKNQDELNRNAVMMMEMQETIQHMQREYALLHSKYMQAQPPEQPPDASVMFTRLDSDRNAKALKKAVMDERLVPEKYKEAVDSMEKYVGLPSRRFQQLVKKYVHHCQMKKIEENVRNSKSLNDDVFTTLDHMEALQNVRARRWAEEMDGMGEERLRLAHQLMETLDSLEQESGIFLVKPMFSYRGRVHMDKYIGRLSPRKLNKAANIARMSENGAQLPTPAANISRAFNQTQRPITGAIDNFPTADKTDPEITGTSVNWVGNQRQPVWNMNASVSRSTGPDYLQSHLLNTPRILDLDVNRMMIGQSNISARLTSSLSDDRLINAANTNLRSYMTVNRPSVNRVPSNTHDRPNSGPDTKQRTTTPLYSPHPPTTAERQHSRGRSFDEEGAKTFSNTPPLPPITPSNANRPQSTPTRNNTDLDMPLPPRSPPGSSLRQSPPPDNVYTPQPVTRVTTTISSQPTNIDLATQEEES